MEPNGYVSSLSFRLSRWRGELEGIVIEITERVFVEGADFGARIGGVGHGFPDLARALSTVGFVSPGCRGILPSRDLREVCGRAASYMS